MRRLVAIVAILALLWTGAWLGGRALLGRMVEGAILREVSAGRLEVAPEVTVAGFPGRLGLRLGPLAYDNPDEGLTLQAGGVRADLALWRPWQAEALVEMPLELTLGWGQSTFSAGRLAVSVALRPRLSLPLDLVEITGSGLHLAGPAGAASVDDMVASLGADPARGTDYALALTAHGIRPDAAVARLLLAPGAPADEADGMRGTMVLDLDLTLSAPLDRHMNTSQPYVESAELHGMRFDLGDLHVTAQGAIKADSDGMAAGKIITRIEGWQVLPDALAGLGLIEPGIAPTLYRLSEAYAKQQNEGAPDGALTVTLHFGSGWIYLGPLPLGPAPRLAP